MPLAAPEGGHTTMVAGKSKLSVRAAVMNCLARCTGSEAPLCCLGDFLEKLGEMGWNPQDVQTVRTTVLRLLDKPLMPEHVDADDASLAAQ
jgi:hypothetical protein